MKKYRLQISKNKSFTLKISAFSLSEVLITLGVIGVVSAITLPVIHSKIQDHILKNRFKKGYNTYLSAIQMINMENGDLYNCYYIKDSSALINECTKFYQELATKLKYVKYCPSNAFQKGCIPEYSKYFPEDNVNCSGFNKESVNYISQAWVLNDGSIMFTYGKGNVPFFALDINGFAKPNKGGYDLFVFQITKRDNSMIFSGKNSCNNSFKETGGKTIEEMLLN